MLEQKYNTLEEIPEGYAHLYAEKDGAFVLRTASEIKTPEDTARLQTALSKERSDHAQVKSDLKKITGERTPDQVLEDLDKIEEYKLAADNSGTDEVKIEQLVETRVKSRLAPVERKLESATATLAERDQALQQYAQNEDNRLIEDHVRAAATKLNVNPLNMDDALTFGRSVMQVVDENGTKRVVTKDNAGVAPGIEADVMLGDMQGKRRWWDDAQGAGSTGGNGGAPTTNPWSASGWNLTEQGKVFREQGKDKADQMAKAAGTTLGGAQPEAK